MCTLMYKNKEGCKFAESILEIESKMEETPTFQNMKTHVEKLKIECDIPNCCHKMFRINRTYDNVFKNKKTMVFDWSDKDDHRCKLILEEQKNAQKNHASYLKSMRKHISEFHQEDFNQYEFIQQLRKRKCSQVAVTNSPAAKKSKIDHESSSEEEVSEIELTSSDSDLSSDAE